MLEGLHRLYCTDPGQNYFDNWCQAIKDYSEKRKQAGHEAIRPNCQTRNGAFCGKAEQDCLDSSNLTTRQRPAPVTP